MHLADPIDQHFRLLDVQRKGLHKLGLNTIHDILYYFPSRYSEASEIKNIRTLRGVWRARCHHVLDPIRTQQLCALERHRVNLGV